MCVCFAVKSYGTEGRRAGESQVPPGEEVYEYIVFRGDFLKIIGVVSVHMCTLL